MGTLRRFIQFQALFSQPCHPHVSSSQGSDEVSFTYSPGIFILFLHPAPHPWKGKVPSAITMALTKNPPLLNFSVSDYRFISCLTHLATAHSSPNLTYFMAITA